MMHEEQRIWLIKELQKTPSQLSGYPVPDDEQGQKDLLCSLKDYAWCHAHKVLRPGRLI